MRADIHMLWADVMLPGTVMWSSLTSAFYCAWSACECWMPRDPPSGESVMFPWQLLNKDLSTWLQGTFLALLICRNFNKETL